MGLRCLLGHDFGEPELQREREEDGDEVVTTVKEVKTCARCGEAQIVSENTEVTTMEQLADEAAANAAGRVDPTGGADPGTADGPSGTPAGSDAPAVDASGASDDGIALDEEPGAGSDDAVILGEGPSDDGEAESAGTGADPGAVNAPAGAPDRSDAADESDPSQGPERAENEAELLDADSGSESGGPAAVDAGPESGSTDDPDAETDDGVILDDDEEESPDDRERGAWPSVDEEDAEGDDRTAWPDHGGEDEGFSAEVGEGSEADVEFGGGLTPEAAEGDAESAETAKSAETEYVESPDDAEPVSFDAGGEGGTGITRSERPDLETAGGDGPTEYYCPECGMVRAADGSSMRAGDICPECKRGYVDERPR